MALLEVRDITVRFGGITALDGLSFDIERGQICGLIGPNGAGKTTMFNVVSRIYQPTSGVVRFDGKDLLALSPHHIAGAGIARTFQNLALFPRLSVLDNVMVGAHATSKVSFYTAPLRIGVKREERELTERAMYLLSSLGLAKYALHPAAGLPFGTLKRIEIARAMAASPKLLLLDEPASGLTHSEVDELAELIRSLRSEHNLTVLLVEHHMRMVMGISDNVVVLDFGRKIADGTPSDVQASAAVQQAYLGVSA